MTKEELEKENERLRNLVNHLKIENSKFKVMCKALKLELKKYLKVENQK